MYTYLIVDDETLIRKGTIKKLAPIQDQVTCIGEADNGSQALQMIAKLNPDIIITDMNMPVLDGTQFLPILTEKYPDKCIIVISGYKDFEYMKKAITANAVDYILKPFSKEDVQESVRKAISQMKRRDDMQNQIISSEEKEESARYEYDIQMLKNIILGYHTSKPVITSKNLNFINTTHNLVLITLCSDTAIDEILMQSFLEENSFGDLALYLQHIHHQNLGFLVLFIPEHAALSPAELCRQIIRSLNRMFTNMPLAVSYGVSGTHKSLLDLHGAFMETVTALNSMKVPSAPQSYFYSSAPLDSTPVIWDRSNEFLFRIEAGMAKEVSALLDDLFEQITRTSHYTLYDIKVYCFWLSDQVKSMMTEYFDQVTSGSANTSMQNILNSMFSISELKEYYLQFYLNIASILRGSSVYSMDDTVEKIKIYIQRNYYNNLTIEFISSLFYLNRSYCSHLFKEKTGETFVNYLNKVRLDKAKQLLETSDKKMYQIAKSVGYDNAKYFFRIFKRYEHVTPEQYRKNLPD